MASESRDPGRIVVPGVGRVVVRPDVASLRLGVVVVRPTAGEARQAAAATMTAVVDALQAGGVEPKDLRTSLVSLDAVRDYSSERGPRVTGYQLSNAVEATIRTIDAAGGLIDAALAAGATSLDGLSFRLADPRDALAEARRLAVADARARAETLAGEAGVELGRVVAITEGGFVAPGPPLPMAELHMKSASDVATPVEAGTDELSVTVSVTYAIA
jgi:uncharacterized protein YggE